MKTKSFRSSTKNVIIEVMKDRTRTVFMKRVLHRGYEGPNVLVFYEKGPSTRL